MGDPATKLPSREVALPIAPGDLVAGKYRIDTLLGMGGMAAVLAATHVELDQPVAVKVLLPERAVKPDAVRRFLTEARAAAKLKSEHVARISDVGTTETAEGRILPFIVMERLDGSDLASVLESRGKVAVHEAIDFVRQACEGLAEAHALGIVHRDVKPANLFVARMRDGQPVVKLLDFGISKSLTRAKLSDNRAITGETEMMGSPGYMSPEQVRAAKNVDLRTDIWSIGVVLYELVTGKEAFAGESINEIFGSILHSPPNPIEESLEDIPAEVRDIIRCCLQKDAAERYQTIGELSAALAEAAARPIVIPKKRISPAALAGGAAALVLAVVLGAFALTSNGTPPGSPPPTVDSAVLLPSPAPGEPLTEPVPAVAAGASAVPAGERPASTALEPLPANKAPAPTPIVPTVATAATIGEAVPARPAASGSALPAASAGPPASAVPPPSSASASASAAPRAKPPTRQRTDW